MTVVVPIIEGHGEVEAVPKLLHRITRSAGKQIAVNPPIRVKASSFCQCGSEFARFVELAANKARQTQGIVLILLDCDDGCPAETGSTLLAAARELRPDVQFLVNLAVREYETWLIYGAATLAGHAGLPEGLEIPDEPERFRDAKGWFAERMGRKYVETQHQAEFTVRFDLEAAKRSPSFRRLYDRLVALIS